MRRIAVVLGTIGLTLALTSAPASADQPYQPLPTDFADCPAKPADAVKWTCVVHTAIGGGFRIGTKQNFRILIDKTMRLTIGKGERADGSKISAWGSLRQPQNFKVVSTVPGTNIILSVLPEFEGRLHGLGLASADHSDGFKARIQLWNPGGAFGQNCTIGSDAAPVVIKPVASLTLPWVFGLVPMLKSWTADKTFALPSSQNCGSIPIIMPNGMDGFLGLPSASGVNEAEITWAVRHKDF